jgi:osmotically-inducible protein OsmY
MIPTYFHKALSDIQTVAERRLRGSPYLALRAVQCDFACGVLTLRGTLGSFYLKQIAQECVNQLDNVERIDNQIEVTAADLST